MSKFIMSIPAPRTLLEEATNSAWAYLKLKNIAIEAFPDFDPQKHGIEVYPKEKVMHIVEY